MTPRWAMALNLTGILACQHAGAADPWGRVLERGGELAEVALDQQKLTVTDSTITAWGVIEVPDGSRLSATYAGVDAIARSEVLKFVRVRIADVMVSVDSTEPARRDAYEHTLKLWAVPFVMRASRSMVGSVCGAGTRSSCASGRA